MAGQNGVSAPQAKDLALDAEDERRKLFAREYHELCTRFGGPSGVALVAYKRVYGAAPHGMARLLASNVLNHPTTQQCIQDLRAGLMQRHAATVDRVIEELERIAFANPMDIMEVDPETKKARIVIEDIHTVTASAISTITVKDTKFGQTTVVQFHDKNAALTQLSKIFGIEQNKLTITLDQLDELIRHYTGAGAVDITPNAVDQLEPPREEVLA